MKCNGCHSIEQKSGENPKIVEKTLFTYYSIDRERVDVCEDCSKAAWQAFKGALRGINNLACLQMGRIMEEEQRIRTKEIQAARRQTQTFEAPKE